MGCNWPGTSIQEPHKLGTRCSRSLKLFRQLAAWYGPRDIPTQELSCDLATVISCFHLGATLGGTWGLHTVQAGDFSVFRAQSWEWPGFLS